MYVLYDVFKNQGSEQYPWSPKLKVIFAYNLLSIVKSRRVKTDWVIQKNI